MLISERLRKWGSYQEEFTLAHAGRMYRFFGGSERAGRLRESTVSRIVKKHFFLKKRGPQGGCTTAAAVYSVVPCPLPERPLFRAVEVFLIVRELKGGGEFRWKDWVNAYDSIFGEPYLKYLVDSDGQHRHLHMTVGSMIRAQLHHKTIKKLRFGRYVFVENKPKFPLYHQGRQP